MPPAPADPRGLEDRLQGALDIAPEHPRCALAPTQMETPTQPESDSQRSVASTIPALLPGAGPDAGAGFMERLLDGSDGLGDEALGARVRQLLEQRGGRDGRSCPY